jgi:O-acetyl-ADP-ribose deacetylase (regulator of RNase III)
VITIEKGDLLNSECDIIAHQVNCQGVMGSGVAFQIKEQWPIAFARYLDFLAKYKMSSNALGKIQIVEVSDNKYVCNIFGQDRYGYKGNRYTSYDALDLGFKSLGQFALKHKLSIGLPFNIGCDRGGGNWQTVLSLLNYRIPDDVICVLYKLKG